MRRRIYLLLVLVWLLFLAGWSEGSEEVRDISNLRDGQFVLLDCGERTLQGTVANNAPDFVCLKVRVDSWNEVPAGETILVFKRLIKKVQMQPAP
ncbi:MAG: hypothetical protein EBZ78_11925 [Verrucomicrobia bacterium]|nr:hypothetical protein [Verrucomicrobiota bacterium]